MSAKTGNVSPVTMSSPSAPASQPHGRVPISTAAARFQRLIHFLHGLLPALVSSRLPVTFIGYAIINGSAFVLDIAVLSLMVKHPAVPYPLAVTVGYILAGIYSLLLNRWLNFQSHDHIGVQGSRYMVGLVSQYVIFILGLSSLLHWLGVPPVAARVISACCEGVYLYILMHLWVFRSSTHAAQVEETDSSLG